MLKDECGTLQNLFVLSINNEANSQIINENVFVMFLQTYA